MTIRASYTGYTKGTENHGDEALMWIIRDLLAPEIEVVFDDSDCELAILGGGTLINQSPWLIDLYQARLSKASWGVVFGTGVGNPVFWGNHFARWNPLLEKCTFAGVRGPHALRHLKENGFHNARMIGDPYLVLNKPLHRTVVPKTIGLNFGSTNNALFGGHEEDFLQQVLGLVRELTQKGWKIVWVSVWEKDLEIMRSLRAELPGEPGPLYDARRNTMETLSALSGCELFLGEKLHAIAMSAVASTPFIAWEYQPKVRDFTESIGMGEWTFPTSEREPATVLKHLEKLRDYRGIAAHNLENAVAKRRTEIQAFAKEIRRHAAERAAAV